ncbi:hypothetical protein K438DRAFT_1805854, partial [Mycena galopus ATCC 62051]
MVLPHPLRVLDDKGFPWLLATLKRQPPESVASLSSAKHPTTTTAFFREGMSSLCCQNGARTDASHAALLNEFASHVHEYNDAHLPTIIHPTG